MCEQAASVALSLRQSDPAYPGVVARVGDTVRIIVSLDLRRYVLQVVGMTDGGPLWMTAGGRCPGSADKIAAKYSAALPGLAEVCAALPDDPATAAPVFASRRAAQLAEIDAERKRRV